MRITTVSQVMKWAGLLLGLLVLREEAAGEVHQEEAALELKAKLTEFTEVMTQAHRSPSPQSQVEQGLEIVFECLEIAESHDVEEDQIHTLRLACVELMYAPWPWWRKHVDEADTLADWLESALPDLTPLLAYECIQWQLARGVYEDAQRLVETCLEFMPAEEALFLPLALKAYRLDLNWEKAEQSAERLSAKLPELVSSREQYLDYLQAAESLGAYFLRLGLPERADRVLRPALRRARSNVTPLERQAISRCFLVFMDRHLFMSELTRASEEIQEFRQEWQGFFSDDEFMLASEACVRLQVALEDDRERAEALEFAENALQVRTIEDSSRVVLQILIAQVLLRLERYDEVKARLDFLLPSDSQGNSTLSQKHAGWMERRLCQVYGEWALEVGTPKERQHAREMVLKSFEEMIWFWQRSPVEEGGIGYLGAERQNLLILTLALLEETQETERAFECFLKTQGATTVARKLALPTPSLAELRSALLPEGDGILAYGLGAERSFVFVIDEEGLELMALNTPVSLYENPLLGGRDLPSLEEASQQLTDALLPSPVRQRIAAWEHVMICGDSRVYGALDLAVGEDHKPLGIASNLCYLPAIPFALELARRPPLEEGSGASLVVGSERGPQGKGEFSLGPEGAAALLESVDVLKRDVWWSSEPLPSKLDWSSQALLHFLGHGVFDRSQDRISGLHIREGQILWADDLEQAKLPRLVIFSACGAARGHRRMGEDGHGHLGGAALLGGAWAVLLSKADLRFESTFYLTKLFTENVMKGKSFASALRQAKASLEKEIPAEDWSQVWLYGLGNRKIPAQRPSLAKAPDAPSGDMVPKPREEASAPSPLVTRGLAFGLGVFLIGFALIRLGMLRRGSRQP